ncbi:N-acetylglucosaminylphosphatidylinositol deacetylase [Toxoplasma gondii RUB]|uniref:N-acetylglucosaminylphosphatidylinositol deacetylase n=1 Tax=Toxoplasma gondii RUB TaxID=935652 RepID=A0A086M879_TOXGO|nr:N-acetylglucosaminylphosphatidylinositol deacetylase [Toxoplasma gondii RUB]
MICCFVSCHLCRSFASVPSFLAEYSSPCSLSTFCSSSFRCLSHLLSSLSPLPFVLSILFSLSSSLFLVLSSLLSLPFFFSLLFSPSPVRCPCECNGEDSAPSGANVFPFALAIFVGASAAVVCTLRPRCISSSPSSSLSCSLSPLHSAACTGLTCAPLPS